MATIELDKRIWNRNVSRRNELWNLRSFGHSKNTRQLKLYAGEFVSSSKCYFNLETIFNFQWKFQFRRAIRVCQLSVEEQNERISVIEENRRNKIDKTKLRGSCGRRGGRFSRKNSATRRSKLIKAGGLTMKKWNRRGDVAEKRKRGRKEEKETCSSTFHFQLSSSRQQLTSFRLLIASILQQPNVKLAATQFVTRTELPLKLTRRWLTLQRANFSIKSRRIQKLANDPMNAIAPPFMRLCFVNEVTKE